MSTLNVTYKELKEFVNSIPEDQLDNAAFLQVPDEIGHYICEIGFTDEDHYLTDEGWAPVSTFEPYDESDKIEDYSIQKAGHPFMIAEY